MINNVIDYLPCIANFPIPGVMFRDISPLLADPKAFSFVINGMKEKITGWNVDYLIGIESRGFLFASALGYATNKGVILARKPGKLPAETISESYGLEYGSDSIEIKKDILPLGSSVVLVDDVIATGGTLLAAKKLVERMGSTVAGVVCLLSIDALEGEQKLKGLGVNVESMIHI